MIPDLLFPRRCPVCGGIPPDFARICPECVNRLPWIRGKRCLKCGKPVEDAEVLCSDCMLRPHDFDRGTGIFLYEDVMREAVSGLKYRGRKEYGETLGLLMGRCALPCIREWKAGALIPVPVHRSRLAARGYNQAEVLAEGISRVTGLPVLDCLMRTEKTTAMKKLTREERKRAVGKAMALKPGKRVPERVIIVDDIYTTGATVDSCAAVLRSGGAGRVFFITLAIGGGLQ